MWDLERENCIAQLNLPPPPSTSGSGSNSGGEGATVEHLAASGTSPLLYAADATGTADAVMGDEPFASRLLAEHRVFFLANLAEPDTVKTIRGAGFLHAALETRGEVIRSDPEKAGKMVRMLKASLAWIAGHTPEQVIEALAIADPEERQALLFSLRKYPRAFSPDGRFSTGQLRETDIFFHTSNQDNPKAQALGIESMVDDRWADRKP